MNFQKASSSTEANAGMQILQRQLQGAEQTKMFGDTFDDGSGTFPDLKPSGKPRAPQTDNPRAGLPARVLLCYQMALQRDAAYASASRGALLLQGWQADVLRCYDEGRQFQLAFL